MKAPFRWLPLFALPQLVLAQLSYVESSAGLDAVRYDGGLTEVELGDVNGDGRIDLITIGDHGSPDIGTPEHGIMVYFRVRVIVLANGERAHGVSGGLRLYISTAAHLLAI